MFDNIKKAISLDEIIAACDTSETTENGYLVKDYYLKNEAGDRVNIMHQVVRPEIALQEIESEIAQKTQEIQQKTEEIEQLQKNKTSFLEKATIEDIEPIEEVIEKEINEEIK